MVIGSTGCVHFPCVRRWLACWVAVSCVGWTLADWLHSRGASVGAAEPNNRQHETSRADKPHTAGGWRVVASTHVPRESSSLVMLNDGRVLVISGHRLQPLTTQRDTAEPLDTAEIYDPDKDTWELTPRMHAGHHGAPAVLLDDGRVLVAGGSGKVGQESSVEIFDPRKSTWLKTKPMAVGRSGFSLEKLPDGRLLAAGGIDWDAEKILSVTEIFDPRTETWSREEDLPSPRYGHMSARLGDRVVVFGGSDSNKPPLTTSAEFDVSAKSWRPGPKKSGALNSAKLQMSNGQILVCGGSNATGETKFPSAAILDPRTDAWTPTGVMSQHRSLHTLTQLSDGRVLAAGGSSSRHHFLNSAEIWNPSTGKWTAAEPMTHARHHHRAVLLRSGEVLVVGGYSYQPTIQAMDSCEIFRAPQ